MFLRGRDADGRLRELAASRAAARPLLGALAGELLRRRLHESLGYRCLGDFARERLGVGARVVREWARVWARLESLPSLREAVLTGEVSWSAARLVVGVATPETELACVEAVRGRTFRAVEAIVAAVRRAEHEVAAGSAGCAVAADEGGDDERVSVRLRCTPREAGLWVAAVELARRVAGEELAVWQCAERIAAEAASAVGAPDCAAGASGWEGAADVGPAAGASACGDSAAREHGRRERAFSGLRWKPLAASLPHRHAVLARDLPACTPREVERRLVAAVAFLQRVDFEVARVLRQVVARRLHRELGFGCFERYARERLDLAPRTARRLVSLARVEHRAPEAASAFRTGRITAFQAQAIARVADLESARAWVERARAVSLRRLLDDVGSPPAPEIAFTAPRAAARFFVAMLGRAGSLERMLAHAIATWMEAEAQFRDYADFARDGYRCTVPGCSARRNLQSHHVRFRSAGGPDEAWNRTTLCAHHHLRGVHGGTLRIRGRAPAELVFALGPEPAERFRSGDVRVEGGRG